MVKMKEVIRKDLSWGSESRRRWWTRELVLRRTLVLRPQGGNTVLHSSWTRDIMLTYGIPLITDFQWRKRLRKKVPKEEQSEQKPRMNEMENYVEKPSRAQPAWRHLQASWTVRRWWHSEEKDNVNLKISIKDKSPSIMNPPALLQGMSVQDWKESPKMQMVAFHRQRPATNSCCDIS